VDDDSGDAKWFRRALEIGGVAGGSAGFLTVGLFSFLGGCFFLFGGFDVFADWVRFKLFIVQMAILGGTVFGGIAGGCLLSVGVGRLMRGRNGFVPVTVVVGIVGGILGAYCLFFLCSWAVFRME
jgi:hypothetical protein